MKYCNEYAPLLSAFVDGELSAAEREQVLAHLDECEACRSYLAELTAMHAAFGEFEEVDVPAGFAAGVMARAKQDAWVAKKVARRRRFAPLAACAALFLFVSVTTMPWLGSMKAAPESAKSAAPMEAGQSAGAETEPAAAPEAAMEEEFFYVENSIAYSSDGVNGGILADSEASATEEAAPAPEAAEPADPEAVEDYIELKARYESALVLRGVSADNYLKGWGSKVDGDLYCIDPELLKNLPAGLSLSAEDEEALYASEEPFVYVIAEVTE